MPKLIFLSETAIDKSLIAESKFAVELSNEDRDVIILSAKEQLSLNNSDVDVAFEITPPIVKISIRKKKAEENV